MNYESVRKSASAGIRSAGFKMTARRSVPGEYDEVAGQPAAPTVQEWDVYGIKASLGKLTKYAEFSAHIKSLVEAGAIMLILEAVGYVPKIGDQIYLPGGSGGDSIWWTVQAADGLDPGGVDTMFNVMVLR